MALRNLVVLSCAALAEGSFENIVGYGPNSKVTDHNALDLDQQVMESLFDGTEPGYTAAQQVYVSGGHSKSYADITHTGTIVNSYAEGSTCTMKDASGNTLSGALKSAVTAGTGVTIPCLYPTSQTQATYMTCQVGGLPSADQTITGCIDTTQDVVLTDGTNTDTVASANIVNAVNKNGRTLQGFATAKTNFEKMYDTSSSCPGCPYEGYRAFFNYYGEHGWADKFVTAALDGTSVTFGATTSGTAGAVDETKATSYNKVADFLTYNDQNTRKEAAKKGSAYMNVWMYVIREFEDAIDDCSTGSLNNNYGSVHAWDEGVAFYAGSLEGQTVANGIANSGKMVHALADKRCSNFGTCNSDDGSKVNSELLVLFQRARNLLMTLQCSAVRPVVTKIEQLMTVPLIQGTLRYAYKMATFGPGGANTYVVADNLKANAEGATFAFALLPLLARCSDSAAKTVYDNMKLGAYTTCNKDAVKAAFEANYACMGVTCADVGALTEGGGCASTDLAGWCTQCAVTETNSYEKIAGYSPRSKVTDHNAMDLDQAAMETELALKTAAGFTNGKNIYTQGGNSKSYATFTVPGTDTAGTTTPAFPAGTNVIGTSATGETVYGTVKSAAAAGATSLKVTYQTTAVQASYNGHCQDGALTSKTTTGCFGATNLITVGYTSITPTAVSNVADRTLQGFASASTTSSKMYTNSASCPGCPYDTFKKFYDYYGDLDYADKYVTAALDGTTATFSNLGGVDYSSATQGSSYSGRVDATKKGTAYMNVWMYVVREFEDAIDDCETSSIDNNYGSAHAWDEGVAFYTGSLEGTAVGGSGGGKMIYRLAEKRCQNFNTCGSLGNADTGVSKVNVDLFAKFSLAQNYLYTGDCSLVRPVLNEVIELMTIPLVQGVLRYAYKLSVMDATTNPATDDKRLKEEAEGATFAAAMLPLLSACSAADAAIVKSNMAPGASMSMDKDAVKAALERNYICMGFTCAHVGALTEAGGCQSSDLTGWCTVCTDPSPPPPPPAPVVNVTTTTTVEKDKEVLSTGAIAGIAVAGVIALLFCVCITVLIMKEKKGQPVFANLEAGSTSKGPPA